MPASDTAHARGARISEICLIAIGRNIITQRSFLSSNAEGNGAHGISLLRATIWLTNDFPIIGRGNGHLYKYANFPNCPTRWIQMIHHELFLDGYENH